MPDRVDDNNPAPHFDGEQEPVTASAGGPKMGIRIDADPEKKQNPNPFHLDDKSPKGIKNFSQFFGK